MVNAIKILLIFFVVLFLFYLIPVLIVGFVDGEFYFMFSDWSRTAKGVYSTAGLFFSGIIACYIDSKI